MQDLKVVYNNVVEIDYTNWKGERGVRRIQPRSIKFNRNEWHPETQWLLFAFDLEEQAYRDFAIKDIHSWKPIPEYSF